MKNIKIDKKYNSFQIFHSIFHISYSLKKRARSMLIDLDISEAEARTLFFIGLRDGEITIHDLIESSKIHKSTVRQKIKPLVEKGILDINTCDIDRREKKVKLTINGEKLFKKILEINKKYKKKIFKDFNEDEIDNLLFLLAKLELNFK